jgi:tryptophan halogenase
MVNTVLVLGGGSAGFLAALTLKRRIPALDVVVVRSPDIGVIGVGEGTTVAVTHHLHGALGLDPNPFHREAEPIWKLGLRFLWGKRHHFDYAFSPGLDVRYPDLPKPAGYYAMDDMADYSVPSALMDRGRAFLRTRDGKPAIDGTFAYHLENVTFVRWLERTAAACGVRVVDGTVADVTRDDHGVTGLTMTDGRRLAGDLYVDASGFRSVLMRGTMGEPVVDYRSTLWCDRAVIGGWDRRPDEPILPYTTCETMDAGWAWRIDHDRRINRGYVYSSAFLSDADAEGEFRRKNPAVGDTRVIRFASGRCERAWVGNVVAIGNAFGFVEPLEATSLGMICSASNNLAEMLIDGDRHVRQVQRDLYNAVHTTAFDAVRWFLGIHYKFNDRLDTPFWTACRAEVNVDGLADLIGYYREMGPSALFRTELLTPHDPFGVEGYLVMLVGQRVPFRRSHEVTGAERQRWAARRASYAAAASAGVPVDEAVRVLRNPGFGWPRGAFGGGTMPASATAVATVAGQ